MELGPKQWEPVVPFYLFFNVMLWILLVLNIYWFAVSIHFAPKKKSKIDNLVADFFKVFCITIRQMASCKCYSL